MSEGRSTQRPAKTPQSPWWPHRGHLCPVDPVGAWGTDYTHTHTERYQCHTI